jgi:hypothetical protein
MDARKAIAELHIERKQIEQEILSLKRDNVTESGSQPLD